VQRLLLLFPTLWDAKQLELCRGSVGALDVVLGDPADAECPWDFDLAGYLARLARDFPDVSGVASTSDYPGAAAAAILVERLGLRGPSPRTVLTSGHKYLSRISQKVSVPDAVPAFHLVDPRAITPFSMAFPCFLKPVKGSFSVMTRRVESREDLSRFLRRPAVTEFLTYYVHLFDTLLGHCPELEIGARYFLAEELLTGTQVTVEGYASGQEVHILGVVDSVLDPRTGSFLRFDYPSRLSPELVARLSEIATRAMRHLGWKDGLFNVEMIVDPAGERMYIIEVNPRLCGQFADLHLQVDGVSTYRTLIELALGRPVTRGGPAAHGTASSFPLRVFEPSRTDALPGLDRIREIEARLPGSLIWIEGDTGHIFDDFDVLEDGQSARYGVVNVAGEDHREVLSKFRQIEAALGCRFTALDVIRTARVS
jgi:biotin carboxylase